MKTTNSYPRALHGFTLVELMITVAIIAIIAAIAYPSYQRHVIRTHRGAAEACLSEHAQFMERYYTTNLTYVDAEPAPGCASEGAMPDRYEFAFVGEPTRSTYTISATPVGPQLKDGQCGTLTLNQAGTKGANDVDACW